MYIQYSYIIQVIYLSVLFVIYLLLVFTVCAHWLIRFGPIRD